MNSFIGWVGGKKLLRNEICNRFPDKIDRYIEVFGGAGWVLFNKDKHAELEVYNDINSNLVNLFRCVKYHPNALIEEMEFTLNSREVFNLFKSQSTDGLTDIQKACRYFYMIKTSYGCKVSSFGGNGRKVNNLDILHNIKTRLDGVVIENKSYGDIIKHYDRDKALFYLDPPYFKTEKYYDTGDFVFNEEQHIILRDMLKVIKGKFILSYNDCEFIRDTYKDFNIEEISRQNNLASFSGSGKVYKELIITNY